MRGRIREKARERLIIIQEHRIEIKDEPHPRKADSEHVLIQRSAQALRSGYK